MEADRNRKILILGRKIVEISTIGVPDGMVEIVERDLGVQRGLVLSAFEAGWLGGVLSRIWSSLRWGLYATLRGGSRRLEITRRQNSQGEFVAIAVYSPSIRGRILIPVSEYGNGWKDLANALYGFGPGGGANVEGKGRGNLSVMPQGEVSIKPREEKTYLQAASSGGWPSMSCEIQAKGGGTQEGVEVVPSSCTVIPFLRDRCLVGSLVDWMGEVPRAKELERWCNSCWGIGAPVQVKDMNGNMYLFTLPSRTEVFRIRKGSWKFEGSRLELCSWEDRCGCYVDRNKPETLWVRILGLPVFLWSENLFRAIGDRCGGYISTADETMRRDHIKWARICVRGMGNMIPASISVGMGSLVYSCPIWAESGVRVVSRSAPSRWCDGNRWREMMGKEVVGGGYGTPTQRVRGPDERKEAGTRGGNVQEYFENGCQRPRPVTDEVLSQNKPGKSFIKYVERDRNNTEEERGMLAKVDQWGSTLGWQLGKGGRRNPRVLFYERMNDRRGKGWADSRPSNRGGLINKSGPRHQMGFRRFNDFKPLGRASYKGYRAGPVKALKGVEGWAGERARITETRTMPIGLGQNQAFGSNKDQADHFVAVKEDDHPTKNCKSLVRNEGAITLQNGYEDSEREDESSEVGNSHSGMTDWAVRRSGRVVHAEDAGDGMGDTIEDSGQSQGWRLGTNSVDVSPEGGAFDIVPWEHTQVDPIAAVGPRGEIVGQEVGGDWLLGNKEEVVTSDWARRKLKGFGKFLGISYGGMEEEAARLFARIEEQWSNRVSPRGGRSRGVVRDKGKRELRNLEWSVSDGSMKGRGRSWPRGNKEGSWVCSKSDIVLHEV